MGKTRVPEIEAAYSCAKGGSFSAKRSSSAGASSLCPRFRSDATTHSHQIENVSFPPAVVGKKGHFVDRSVLVLKLIRQITR